MSVLTLDQSEQQFAPLFPEQTESVILARMIGWANEGLDPVADADVWVDTREGGHWRTCIIPVMRELARLYDLAGNDVPMSGFVLWSWGTYLDDLAAVWDVQRLAATFALGAVTFDGPDGTIIDAGTQVLVPSSTPDELAPAFEVTVGGTIDVTATIDLDVIAVDAGSAGNVAAGAIIEPSTPLPTGVTLVGNALPTSSGTDPETDDNLRKRLLLALAGKGPGTILDYIRWASTYPGVGRVQVVPIWNGPGTVLVMASDVLGQPIATLVVDGLQANLDPVAGQGHGVAPIGAAVTVDTPVLLAITVEATFTYETGYSWDGAGGTIAVGPGVQAAISQYLLSILPGGEVVYERIRGLCSTPVGVHDVSTVKLNGATSGNVAVDLLPTPKSPYLSTFTNH